MEEQLLDARGLICPLPVLRARKVLMGMPAGAVLDVQTTDPAAPADFEAFCEATGHRLLAKADLPDGAVSLRIERAAP